MLASWMKCIGTGTNFLYIITVPFIMSWLKVIRVIIWISIHILAKDQKSSINIGMYAENLMINTVQNTSILCNHQSSFVIDVSCLKRPYRYLMICSKPMVVSTVNLCLKRPFGNEQVVLIELSIMLKSIEIT